MESTLGKLTKAMARHGVVAWGIAPPGPHEVPEAVSLWFSGAMQGKMDYLQQHLSLKVSAGNVLEGARAVISAALPYGLAGAVDGVPWPVAGYAWGVDYHLRVQETLTAVARECLPQGSFRVVVDSAPIPERYVAVLAGVGFVGKSGNLIVPGFGPNVVLGEIVTTLALPPTTPSPMDTCGECKLCVDACPTGAIMGDGFINTRKCLSYFTTEARENPPDSAALAFGGRLFGCEECVAACPHKRPMEPLGENPLPMERYYQLPQLPARSTFRGTALSRLGYTKIMVNLCYSLTARSDSPALALLHELAEHSSAAISAAARHALRLKSR